VDNARLTRNASLVVQDTAAPLPILGRCALSACHRMTWADLTVTVTVTTTTVGRCGHTSVTVPPA
jgi:hypothetical protein